MWCFLRTGSERLISTSALGSTPCARQIYFSVHTWGATPSQGSEGKLRRGRSAEETKPPLLQLVLGLQLTGSPYSSIHSNSPCSQLPPQLKWWCDHVLHLWGVWAPGNHIFLRVRDFTSLITVTVELMGTKGHPTELLACINPLCPHCITAILPPPMD